jgi:uncharacterized membrane protein
MKRKRIFFLAINYIQIIICVCIVSLVFGYKRTSLLDDDYIGLFVFLMLITFIVNSLVNVFSANSLTSQAYGNRIVKVAVFILTLLFVLSTLAILILTVAGVYAYFIQQISRLRFHPGLIVTIILSITSLMVLMNQFYFKKHLRKEYREQVQAEIDTIGSESSTHE